MNEPDAINIALAQRANFGVPASFGPRLAEKRIIELVEDGQPVTDRLPGPGPVRDVVAWVVKLAEDVSEVEFAIDDQHGRVVRFRRSRSAAGIVPAAGGKNESKP